LVRADRELVVGGLAKALGALAAMPTPLVG
jgi:hypothetical protein